MALPSSSRPKEIEEIVIKDFEQKKLAAPKLRLSWGGIFIKTMTEWYENLTQKNKKKVTGKQLKRKALSVCYQFKVEYDSLPLDWVGQLIAKCGLKLYVRQKKAPVFNIGPIPSTTVIRDKRFKGLRNLIKGPPEGLALEALEDAQSDHDKTLTDVVVEPKKVKKFLDLSNAPPPPMWLAAYAAGTVLPRELTVYSTDDTNILYYDYNPKLIDSTGKEVKLHPKPRLNVNVFTQPSH